jgi:hypothetical protein
MKLQAFGCPLDRGARAPIGNNLKKVETLFYYFLKQQSKVGSMTLFCYCKSQAKCLQGLLGH